MDAWVALDAEAAGSGAALRIEMLAADGAPLAAAGN
jgi:hypothetical protein